METCILPILIPCVCGGLGAVCRCAVTRGISNIWKRNFPIATLIINAFASFVMGAVMFASQCLIYDFVPLRGLSLYAITGFLGGFSTFSTAIFEGVEFMQKKDIRNCIKILSLELFIPLFCALSGFVLVQLFIFSIARI